MAKTKPAKKQTLKIRLDLGGDLEAVESHVAIFEVSKKKPELLAEGVVEGTQGKLKVPSDASGLLYCVAEIHAYRDPHRVHKVDGRKIGLLTVVSADAKKVTLSEQTTVASAYAFAQFLRVTKKGNVRISGPKRGLRIALGMRENFVSARGKVSDVISTSPNGFETNSYAKFNFLANLLYACLTTQKVYDGFLAVTETLSLLGALHALATDPFTDVTKVYGLIYRRKPVYEPSLTQLRPPAQKKPDHWALSIKVHDSGAQNFLPAGIGYIAFDKNDRMWLANNVRQGTPNSATYCVVLEPNGKPAPFSPVFGGGILGAGFGIAADRRGEKIYVGNFGWGPPEYNPQHGGVSVVSHTGEVLSPPNGYNNKLSRVQGMEVDPDGNLWMASWGTQDPLPPATGNYTFKGRRSSVVVYLDGDPERALRHPFDSPFHGTFDVTAIGDGIGYATNSGSGMHQTPSSVVRLKIDGDRLVETARWPKREGGNGDQGPENQPSGVGVLRQVSVAPNGDVFVVGVKWNAVVRLTKDLEYICQYQNKIHGPWGIVFDPDGTMYVSNFTLDPEVFDDSPIGPFGVTVIRDYDESTAELLTLPTGGEQVTLANGLPLYGNVVNRPTHHPIMRLTGSRIDRAGNVWACNNWKPSAEEDVIVGNPGGDGLVAFVGVSAPSKAR